MKKVWQLTFDGKLIADGSLFLGCTEAELRHALDSIEALLRNAAKPRPIPEAPPGHD